MAELNLGHVVGPGVPTGGTSGQVLKKNSSTNFDTSWSANDATTIPMSSSDSTSINQAIANSFKYVTSGSLHDIKGPGVYSVASAVTDKPSANGGTYVVSNYSNGALVGGTYIDVVTGDTYAVNLYSGTWKYEKLALNQDISKLNSDANQTNDILADAVSCTQTKFFKGSGSAYTGALPNNDSYYGYGIFIVNVRGTNKSVIALSSYTNRMAINYYSNNAWLGWQELALAETVAGKSVSGVDANNLTTTGRYLLNGNITNLPYGNYGYLDVIASGSNVVQYYSNLNAVSFYVRNKYNGTWTDWQELALNSKVKKRLVGEILTVQGTTGSDGVITVSKTVKFTTEVFVASNISQNLSNKYSVTIQGASSDSVNLRIRNMGDNSAVASTSVNFTVLIYGFDES